LQQDGDDDDETNNESTISAVLFNTWQTNMFDTKMGKENLWRSQFLRFLEDAWLMQPKYISKLGPKHCNFIDVMKEFKENMLLPMFGKEVAYYLNGNIHFDHDDFSVPMIHEGVKITIQSFTKDGFFFFFFFFFLFIFFFFIKKYLFKIKINFVTRKAIFQVWWRKRKRSSNNNHNKAEMIF
jgi:hypothetical protein